MLPAAVALLTIHLLVALVLIPPWQQPDEPTHVARAEVEISRLKYGIDAPDPGREAEILRSMVRYHWWEYRGVTTPRVLAPNFLYANAGTPVGIGSPPPDAEDLPTYALVAGRILSWLPQGTVVDDLYRLRVLSALEGLVTLWLAWLGARETFGALGAAAVALVLALHPQFASVATAASSDAVVNLVGAFVWWQAAVAVNRMRILPLAAIWVAAIFAASADRMGVPLLAFAFCASCVVGFGRVQASKWGPTLAVSALAIGGLAGAGLALRASARTIVFDRIFYGGLAPIPDVMTWTAFATFNQSMFQGWWFWLGWVRYLPPTWWMAIVGAVSAAAMAGVGWLFLTRHESAQMRRLLALATLSVMIQLAAVHWAFFRLDIGGQGKYLFPAIVPSLILLWAGIAVWVPPSRRRYAAAALVVLFALLNAAAWGLVAVPGYYKTL